MKPWLFDQFEVTSATVEQKTVTTDDLLGSSPSFVTRTAVGVNGVITGSLQSATGFRTEQYGRENAQVTYYFFPAPQTPNFDQIRNGDRLNVAGTIYDIIWRADEGGTGNSPMMGLYRTE